VKINVHLKTLFYFKYSLVYKVNIPGKHNTLDTFDVVDPSLTF